MYTFLQDYPGKHSQNTSVLRYKPKHNTDKIQTRTRKETLWTHELPYKCTTDHPEREIQSYSIEHFRSSRECGFDRRRCEEHVWPASPPSPARLPNLGRRFCNLGLKNRYGGLTVSWSSVDLVSGQAWLR